MEIEMLKSEKNYVEFYVVGETHTFCNLLRSILAEDPAVKRITYAVEHPITHKTKPKFEVETESKTKPATVLRRASKKLASTCDELRAEFEKALG